MAEKEFVMRLHGDMLHNEIIFLTKCIWLEKGGKLLDERQFKKKYISPCEPDFLGSYEAKMISGNKRWTEKKLVVIEVETKATKESIARKYQQYKEASTGLELYILNIDKFITNPIYGPAIYNWGFLKQWIESELPI